MLVHYICSAFHQNLWLFPVDCRLITLLGRNIFPVRVLNIASGCHFHAGWSDFRFTNEIVHDDVLTFTMVDAGVFVVKRYNPRTGCPPLGDLQGALRNRLS